MSYRYKLCLILLLLTGLLIGSSCNQQDQAPEFELEPTPALAPTRMPAVTPEEHVFDYNGVERMYLLRIPLGLDPTQPAPVILIFHGMGDDPQSMYRAGFNSVADRENIILVYPYLVSHSSTDFIRQLILEISKNVNLDPSRIYVMGFSYGGMLSYFTACDLSDIIAAFAAVSGIEICESPHVSDEGVSLLHIHGLGDSLVSYESGGFGMPPVEEGISYWTQFNGCEDSPLVESTDTITHTTYSQCRDGASIELYVIEGLGHRVPTREISAAEVIWEFFQEHPKTD
jgi:polyhydroxybutyrate depolymerase